MDFPAAYPESDVDGSDAEEERLRDMEALLYSQVHYDQGGDSEDQRQAEVLPAVTEFCAAADSGVASPEADEDAPSSPDVVDLESDSEDEGITVLPRPEPVKRPLITIESSSESEEEESPSSAIDVNAWCKMIKASKAEPTAQKLAPNPMFKRKASEVLVEEEEEDHINRKKRKVDLKKYVASRFSDSTSSDESDSEIEEFPSTTKSSLSLNLSGVVGKKADRKEISVLDFMSERTEPEREQRLTVHRWTDEMHSFYNDIDTEAANLTLDTILGSIKYDPNDWEINSDDRYAGFNSSSTPGRPRYFQRGNAKCHNCSRSGHIARHCPEPMKPIVCTLCAAVGHRAETCINELCLQCGSPNGRYERDCLHCRNQARETCRQCGAVGHVQARCTDNWRRFHCTVDPKATVPVEPLEDVHKEASEVYCYNCGRKGHYLHNCRAYHRGQRPVVLQVSTYSGGAAVMPSWAQKDLTSSESTTISKRRRKRAAREAEKASKRRRLEDFNRNRSVNDLLEQESMSSTQKWRRSIKMQTKWNREKAKEVEESAHRRGFGKRTKSLPMPSKLPKTRIRLDAAKQLSRSATRPLFRRDKIPTAIVSGAERTMHNIRKVGGGQKRAPNKAKSAVRKAFNFNALFG